VYGVEPICKVLQIAPSAYRRHAARRRDRSLRSQCAQRDEPLTVNIQRVWQENHGVYGADKVWRQLSDFTYVSTWQGWLYVAFVINVYARRIVGWRVSTCMTTDFVLDALEQALHARQPGRKGALIHHSDRGEQCVNPLQRALVRSGRRALGRQPRRQLR